MPITYDAKTKRYRNNGKFVSAKDVRREISKTVDVVRNKMRDLGKQVATKSISISDWRIKMGELSKSHLILNSSVGRGGRKQMSLSDWGKVGVKVREQNKYLDRVVRLYESGKLSPAQLEYRSTLYAMAGRTSYFEAEKDMRAEAGDTECRRLINSKEGCAECAALAGEWLPIDDMPDIGSLECGNHCLCEIEYR